jgi:glucose/arabinose dehydrogenase
LDIEATAMANVDYVIFCCIVISIAAIALSILLPPQAGISGTVIEDEQIPYVNDDKLKIELVAEGLNHPTSMAFLGQNDFLVLDKDKGTVQRVTNGNIQYPPLLDLNVDSEGERGMLGISTMKSSDGRTFVFLYYTESTIDGRDTRYTKTPAGNVLYKYEFLNGRLINPKILYDFPESRHSAHNGGKLLTGPDNNLYLVVGDGDSCVDRSQKINGKYVCSDANLDYILNSESSNILNGVGPSGKGGILRMTVDGNAVGKGVLGQNKPLNLYYAYGIRNSFGIAFDPLTGNLWDTENGPGFGDEINLVIPGFNSGWLKIQGFWPVFTYNPVPIKKGYFNHTSTDFAHELVDFDGKGTYREPKFAWNITVGPTALKFFNSTNFGPRYENDLFVGDINKGRIYHFDLSDNRTELVLKGDLKDKIANSNKESRDAIFAGGIGGITDIQVGPDGNLYVLSYPYGKIFRIEPIES